MRGSATIGLIAISLLAAPASVAFAHTDAAGDTRPSFDEPMAPPPTYKANGVTIDEHLGARIPLDTKFRTSDGAAVTLADVLANSDLPTILTFNYSECPMLCSLQLNALSAGLPPIAATDDPALPPMSLGKQFRIVTIDLEPNEPLDKLAKMKAKYIDRVAQLGHAAPEPSGWTFLAAATPGDASGIARVADAVGFHYTYLPEHAEYAHPAALIFLSSRGAVTRYVYGVDFPAPIMRESILKAGFAEPMTGVGFMTRCYHYDPDANSHAHVGVIVMRVGAAGCVVLLLSAFGISRLVRKRRPLEELQS